MRKLVWILAAFLSLTVASTAWAGDAHAKSGGFFAFFHNLFHSSDSAENHPAPAAPAKGAPAYGQQKTKFIYLDDGSGTSNDRSEVFGGTSLRIHGGPMTSDKKDVITPNLLFERELAGVTDILHSASLTPRNTLKTGARIGMSFGPAERSNPLSDLEVSLISRAAVQTPDGAGLTPGASYNSFDRRASSLGVSVDYRGFYVGANYGREQDDLALGYHGYDVGFGYQGHKWSTGVQFSGYQKDSNIMGVIGPDGVRTVQVGAAYSLWPWMTFSGQFRYYDYNNRGSRYLLLDQSRVFTLGTSLNF